VIGKLQKLLVGETRNVVAKATKHASKIATAADKRISAEIADFAQHFRLTEAPALVEQFAKLDEFWGRDVTRQIARDHLGHRGGFIVDLVANAERRGYADLKGLQAALPAHWLSRAPCPFCHSHELLKPLGNLVYESENFVAAPNLRQMFAFDAEKGGHVMVFAKHHRSTPSALPGKYRKELIDAVRKTKRAMEEAYGKPVSLFSNGGAGAKPWILEDVDSHAHIQLFSGDTTVTEAVLKETGISRDRVLPVNGFGDYFKLYEQGKLRGRYILTLDAREKGHVILIGDQPTAGGLAMRNARISLGLPPMQEIFKNEGKASLVATAVKAKLDAPKDAPKVRQILAGAPVPAK
jgi:diadenosine tetraphosphate (Ap4A) HIT family hydrolase